MNIKPSKIEKEFLIGMSVQYLSQQSGGFLLALSREVLDECRRARIEHERVVDPYNRDVVE